MKDEWIAALRAGTYNEGRRALRRSVRDSLGEWITYHDAFGVLCEISLIGEWIPMVDAEDDAGVVPYSYSTGDEGGSGMPSHAVTDMVGLTEADRNRIAWMIDRGDGFTAIADWISENC